MGASLAAGGGESTGGGSTLADPTALGAASGRSPSAPGAEAPGAVALGAGVVDREDLDLDHHPASALAAASVSAAASRIRTVVQRRRGARDGDRRGRARRDQAGAEDRVDEPILGGPGDRGRRALRVVEAKRAEVRLGVVARIGHGRASSGAVLPSSSWR